MWLAHRYVGCLTVAFPRAWQLAAYTAQLERAFRIPWGKAGCGLCSNRSLVDECGSAYRSRGYERQICFNLGSIHVILGPVAYLFCRRKPHFGVTIPKFDFFFILFFCFVLYLFIIRFFILFFFYFFFFCFLSYFSYYFKLYLKI